MKLSAFHDERAQGVVEFAFIITALLLLFLGTVDYARFLYYDSAIQSAVRVSAENASNHCFTTTNCGSSSTTVSNGYLLWSTYCEAAPELSLNPAVTGATNNCQPWSSTPTCTPSGGSQGSCGTFNCQYDTCTIRDSSSSSCSSTHNCVTVDVGFSFKPISFLMNVFFSEQQCWTAAGGASTDDSTATNHHTICARSVGRVS